MRQNDVLSFHRDRSLKSPGSPVFCGQKLVATRRELWGVCGAYHLGGLEQDAGGRIRIDE